MQELLEAYPLIGQITPWLGGALGGFLIFLLKNRRPLLTYSVSHQRIGLTADDEVHGKVEVRYRGNVVQNLYLSVVEIRNRSIQDLENVGIKTCRGSPNMAILTEQTSIPGTLEIVRLTQDYIDRVTADSDWEREVRDLGQADEPENMRRIQSDTAFRHGQRHYTLPVFNRGQSATITYLTTAGPDAVPTIFVTSQTKGVRVKPRQYPQAITHLWGVPIPHAGLAGLFVGAVFVGVLIWQVQTYWITAWISFLIGLFASVPGALSIKGYAWLREKLLG